jgi:hypothetical protein
MAIWPFGNPAIGKNAFEIPLPDLAIVPRLTAFSVACLPKRLIA